MQTNSLKQKLAAGRAVSVIAPFASSAGLVELLGHLEFDGVFIDCEHGPSGWEDVENMVRAAEVAGYSSVVRVDRNDAATITRALDRGAGGIQVPHVNTAAEAQAIVEHAKYAPLGHRGWSGWRAVFGEDSAEYPRRANEQTLVVVMLEEVEALSNLDSILHVDNVDVFFVAPGDLAQSLGYPGHVDHPQVAAALEDALRRIHAAGRISGTLTTPAMVDRHLGLGVQFLYIGLASLLNAAAKEFTKKVGTLKK
jgi:4-hydroxy-2-oxoheptanedioate aldolase